MGHGWVSGTGAGGLAFSERPLRPMREPRISGHSRKCPKVPLLLLSVYNSRQLISPIWTIYLSLRPGNCRLRSGTAAGISPMRDSATRSTGWREIYSTAAGQPTKPPSRCWRESKAAAPVSDPAVPTASVPPQSAQAAHAVSASPGIRRLQARGPAWWASSSCSANAAGEAPFQVAAPSQPLRPRPVQPSQPPTSLSATRSSANSSSPSAAGSASPRAANSRSLPTS